MTADIDITPGQRRTLLVLLRRFIPGVAVWAYGSRVKWTARPNSDLDLVAFTTPVQRPLVSELKEALAESDIPFLVDFHVWDEVPERFHQIIRKEYVVLQEDKQPESDAGIAGVRTVRLGIVCSKIGSGATPRGGKDAYKGGATTLIRSQNIYNDGFHRDGLVYINDNQSFELRNVDVQPNDILLNITGDSVARCCQVATDILPARVNQHVAIIRPITSALDARFLRYVLVSYDYQSRLLALASAGATRPALTKAMIEELDIPAPPLPEQEAIAHILGTLDDKIELNRRMNATLEAMARALFQSWFVDFDPVRAKLDGRKPAGLDAATAALFPAHFQDSKAGHIPKGWTVGKVGDLATLNRGAVNPGNFPTETFDHFSLPAFDNGRTPKVELGSAIMSNKFTVTPNSVLLSKLNPHIPRIWLPDLHASRRSVCSTEFMVACSKSGVSREYLFSLFTSFAFASIYGTLVTGTTGSHQRIRPESVLDMKIVIPPATLIRAFTDIAKPMFDCINRNTEQSRTLATLRDTLLPKLLSGELSVSVPETISAAPTNLP